MKKNFPAFEVAMERVQKARVATQAEYRAKYKELGLPSHPNMYYQEKWKNWGYFLGTGRIVGKNFPTFEVAIQLVQEAGITAGKEYRTRSRELGLPSEPHKYYQENWKGWGHFLGTGQKRGGIQKGFPAFEVAMERVKHAGITKRDEYQRLYKELALPFNPSVHYREKWQGWGHFLGTGQKRGKNFPAFEVAMERVQKARVATQAEYRGLYKKLGLPANPNRYYKLDWKNWAHFLGMGQKRRAIKKDFPALEMAVE